MNRIGLVGYLGYAAEHPIVGGQMAKTQGIYEELCKNYSNEELKVVDTSNWKKEKISLLIQCIKVAIGCKKIIIMPNRNGIKLILPLFTLLKKIFRYQVSYPIVGGWLPGLLKKHFILRRCITKIDYLLPETETLKSELLIYYSGCMDVMPIFSTRKAVSSLNNIHILPYRFCTFSRVTPMKGVDDAIEAISSINQKCNEIKCVLDVWGPIENGYEKHYEKLFDDNRHCVNYRGVLSGDNALEILKEYYMMIFPTRYFNEGFPTAVCECFMAGLPVIGSDWKFNKEIIESDKTGFLFASSSLEELEERILYAIDNPIKIQKMKMNCIEYSKKFEPNHVMQKLLIWLEK